MIYSRFGPGCDFLEFRILLMLFKHIWKLKKYLIVNKKRGIRQLSAIFYFTEKNIILKHF